MKRKESSGGDFSSILIMAAGFVAGSAVYNYLVNDKRAYAAEDIQVFNCDRPWSPSAEDARFSQTLPQSQRAGFLKGLKKRFESECGRERMERLGQNPNTTLSPIDPDLQVPGSKYPRRGRLKSGGYAHGGAVTNPFGGVEYPLLDPKYAKPMYPTISNMPPDQFSTYARAYASAAKKKSTKAAPAADSAPVAKGAVPAASAPAAAGPSAGAGKLPYPTSGKTWKFSDSGKTKRNYASGGSSGTTEWNAEGMGAAANLMGVVYYTHPSSCSGGHGDEADIKMWGPHHSNGGCCWCIVNINGAGQVCTGGEGPHPKTSKCKKTVGNVGSVAGKRIGLCHVITKGSGGAHSEVWIDTGGGFKKIGTYDGACGNAKTSTTPSSGQQVQFRCDCSGVKVESAIVYEISGTAGGGSTSGGTGGGSSAPSAPAAGGGGTGKAKKAGAVYSYTITIA